MRVLFLQDHLSAGGAARAASRFAAGLQKLGVEVAIAAGDATAGPVHFPVTGKPNRGWSRVRELFRNADSRTQSRQHRAQQVWGEVIRDFRPDLIWIHNLHGGLKWGWGMPMVETALAAAPVLWTLHDMWALGEGSFYFPEEELRNQWSRSPLGALRIARSRGRHLLLTPSVWLQNLVRSVQAGPCDAWPNPLNLETFHPRLRPAARRQLKLAEQDVLLLAAAENLADPRKGTDLLIEAWQTIQRKEGVRLALVGRNFPAKAAGDARVMACGSVATEAQMANLMAAADLFIHPSQVESLGLVLEEAQACGTPGLAFAGGGVGETMEAGRTGWLLPERSAQHLAASLQQILGQREGLRNRREACRSWMERKHDPVRFEEAWARACRVLGVGGPAEHGKQI